MYNINALINNRFEIIMINDFKSIFPKEKLKSKRTSFSTLPKDILYLVGEYLSIVPCRTSISKVEIRDKIEKEIAEEEFETEKKNSRNCCKQKEEFTFSLIDTRIQVENEINWKKVIEKLEMKRTYFKTVYPSWYDILPTNIGRVKLSRLSSRWPVHLTLAE